MNPGTEANRDHPCWLRQQFESSTEVSFSMSEATKVLGFCSLLAKSTCLFSKVHPRWNLQIESSNNLIDTLPKPQNAWSEGPETSCRQNATQLGSGFMFGPAKIPCQRQKPAEWGMLPSCDSRCPLPVPANRTRLREMEAQRHLDTVFCSILTPQQNT
jgi:hypothetical protein